jgi:dTDP-4-amino-4,6-dideoxygalactose transaminase
MNPTLETLEKTSLSDLAALGGKAAFDQPLHVGRPNVGDRSVLMERFSAMLDNKWFTNNGPFVQEFEKKLQGYLGVKHVIAMCNATIALEIVARAVGFKGEVIIPSFTFIATAHSLQWQEITPVFCDVDPLTHTIDPAKIEALITPRTTGVVGVHTWGNACDVEALERICARRKLKLVFDAAHAFACGHGGRMIGGFGEAEIFSFHATKFFNTFEGGAVATNNDELAKKIRLMKNFGFSGYDNVIYIGTNGKMTEVSAVMGLTSFDSLDTFIDRNRRNQNAYEKALRGIPGLRFMRYGDSDKRNYQYVILEIDPDAAGLTRDELVPILHKENVLARKYFYPACHKMEPYLSHFPHAGLLLPETNRLIERVMSLPNGMAVDENDIARICGIIRFALANGKEIRERLGQPA